MKMKKLWRPTGKLYLGPDWVIDFNLFTLMIDLVCFVTI